MYKILIDNRNGNMWDISGIVCDITWKTSRIGKAGSLDFTLVRNGIYQDKEFKYENGNVIRFMKDGYNVFYGYIFSIDETNEEDVKISCYDQMRYLMNNSTYVLKNATASEVLETIARDFDLKVGRVDDTGYRIPSMVEDGKKLIDIICKALDYTLINTGKNYFLFDDFGELSIRNIEDFLLDFAIGDSSLMYGYSSKRSIDDNTYNKIKLYKDNKQSGTREVHIEKDSANIAKWGVLQLYESVNENMNDAQIRQYMDTLMILRNRETKSLKIEALGDVRVRAGCYVHVIIEHYGINQPFLVEECTHRFDGADHTMSLELKVI